MTEKHLSLIEVVQCKNPNCDNTFEINKWGRGKNKLYCSTDCRMKSQHYYEYRRKPETQLRQKNKNCLRYGITLDDYNAMFQSQNGCCAICGVHQYELKRSLTIDHNHETGEVRGLLCDNCNHVLGKVREDVRILANMIAYLENSD